MKRILKAAILPVIIFLIFQVGSGLSYPAAAAIQASAAPGADRSSGLRGPAPVFRKSRATWPEVPAGA